jgi:hypothetical protein
MKSALYKMFHVLWYKYIFVGVKICYMMRLVIKISNESVQMGHRKEQLRRQILYIRQI